jgi:hypothetical protein
LVYATGNQAQGLLLAREYMREHVGYARHGLYGREGHLACVFGSIKPEDALDLIVSNMSLQSHDMRVHVLDVICVPENKSFINIIAAGYYILSVFNGYFRKPV